MPFKPKMGKEEILAAMKKRLGKKKIEKKGKMSHKGMPPKEMSKDMGMTA